MNSRKLLFCKYFFCKSTCHSNNVYIHVQVFQIQIVVIFINVLFDKHDFM